VRKFVTATAAAAISLTALAISTVSASAAIACNREGECWHVNRHYAYRPEYGIVIHDNDWRWDANEHYRWREHTGRGYWRNGIWIRF
jgi:hypothetical protein